MGCLAVEGGGYGAQGPTKTDKHLYVSFPPVITNWLLLFILITDIKMSPFYFLHFFLRSLSFKFFPRGGFIVSLSFARPVVSALEAERVWWSR